MLTPTAVPFRIDLTGAAPVVEVDGVDHAAGLDGVELAVGFGQPTRLILHRSPAVGVFSGVAEVTEADRSPAAAVRALDPARVGPLILAAHEDCDMGVDPAAVTLEVIAQLLEAGT